jgi:hypothetical protein
VRREMPVLDGSIVQLIDVEAERPEWAYFAGVRHRYRLYAARTQARRGESNPFPRRLP